MSTLQNNKDCVIVLTQVIQSSHKRAGWWFPGTGGEESEELFNKERVLIQDGTKILKIDAENGDITM